MEDDPKFHVGVTVISVRETKVIPPPSFHLAHSFHSGVKVWSAGLVFCTSVNPASISCKCYAKLKTVTRTKPDFHFSSKKVRPEKKQRRHLCLWILYEL